ncbi:MAG TPA: heparan-alpha-glucosaminide N-acetyltransferase domain-containing protein [Terriglobia bacterium]|nr:heparan-alpha-glucosaminide N-acetyltransferase domain-containing protein [Terriglobia bacterium]
MSTQISQTERAVPSPHEPPPSPLPIAQRLVSLDLFRGVTIAGMILVNNNGDESAAYWPLKHSHWNGWTPTDLVFPFFLFIVGVSMVFSFASRLKRGESTGQLVAHALRRAVILFALGVFLNGFPNEYHAATIRIEGVLQRIALCYLLAALVVLWTGTRGRIAVIAVCLIGYWILMRFVPVPGFGVPTHSIPLLDPDRNLAAWLDRKLLFGHLYEGTRDPEGLLSTIPALATTLIGALTGGWLRSNASARRKVIWMLVWGVAGIAAGKFFGIWFPINKKLWTSPYVLFTGGAGLLGLAVCYWALDMRTWRGRWTIPALVFGMNSIVAYAFSEILSKILDAWPVRVASGEAISAQQFIYRHFFAPLAGAPKASLIYSLAFVVVCWIFAWLLYRKRVFVKI